MTDISPQTTTTTYGTPLVRRDEVDEQYDDHQHGLVCRECHVLVPGSGNHARDHLAWHRSMGN